MSTPESCTLGELVREGRRRLAAAAFKPETREASLLLSRLLSRSEAGILAYPEEVVPTTTVRRFRELLERRLEGEPVAYLLGERDFYGRPFRVDPRVLIPRPETEHLIETVLALDLPRRPRIIDVGTGSGCIAVTLALEIPDARIVATDLSLAALQVARSNAHLHGVEDRVLPTNADLVSPLRLTGVDLVVSNPPYIDTDEEDQLSLEIRDFEPHLALFASAGGRSVMQRLIVQARSVEPGTHLIAEIGYDHSDWLKAWVAEQKPWELIDIIRDYGSIPRTAVLRRQTV